MYVTVSLSASRTTGGSNGFYPGASLRFARVDKNHLTKKEVTIMAIESDAQPDLELDADDAEYVAGGQTAKTTKAQITIPAPIVGTANEPSTDDLEQHR
jgi:hypothetical protein